MEIYRKKGTLMNLVCVLSLGKRRLLEWFGIENFDLKTQRRRN